jgi:hypothetical protein
LGSDFRRLDGRIAVTGERRNDNTRIARVEVEGLGADENDDIPLLANGVKRIEQRGARLWPARPAYPIAVCTSWTSCNRICGRLAAWTVRQHAI